MIVEKSYFERLEKQAGQQQGLPALPPVAADGTCDAIAFARVSIARDIIRERRELGLSQQALAHLAKVRQETVSRIETGKHTPTRRIIERIEKALAVAAKRRRS